MLTGSHTFATLIREGYPINTYLTVALCALVAVNIATEPESRWWTDAVVVFSFLVAVGAAKRCVVFPDFTGFGGHAGWGTSQFASGSDVFKARGLGNKLIAPASRLAYYGRSGAGRDSRTSERCGRVMAQSPRRRFA